jgi:hypothetical protein
VSPRAKAKAVKSGLLYGIPFSTKTAELLRRAADRVWECHLAPASFARKCGVVVTSLYQLRHVRWWFCQRSQVDVFHVPSSHRRNVLDFHIRNLNKRSRPSERRFLLVLLVRNRHPGGIILPKWTRSDKRVSSRFNSFRNIMLARSFSVAFCPDFSDSCTVAVCSYPHQSALGLGGLGLSTFLSTLSLPWRVFCKLRNRRLISLRLHRTVGAEVLVKC